MGLSGKFIHLDLLIVYSVMFQPVTTAEFKVDEFANDLYTDMLEELNKDKLIALGKHLGFSVKIAQRDM